MWQSCGRRRAPRALTVTTPDLTPETRRIEDDLLDVINRNRAHIVGALRDALPAILANLPRRARPSPPAPALVTFEF